ncbi:MAG: hypothetical protein CVT83_01860 [Alphaproteobacteria bacterium HGW-Alphaproteobacteria-5]|nr:MAG: hypothetical protein CVT83_01860 [Alphaproteobacteria bacterium HGW-Alphaproteobacteria-5]
MTASGQSGHPRGTGNISRYAIPAAVGLLIVLLANAHLVYVAVTSQPDCVDHIRSSEVPAPAGSFSAAKSAC